MPRILVIVPFPLPEAGVANRRAQVREDMVDPNTEFVFRPVKVSPALFDSWHDKIIAQMAIFAAGMNAEAEGFDAVCVDSIGDSGMEPLRSVLSIPVLGGGITAYHTALMLADRFSIVTLWEGWMEGYHRTLAAYHMIDRLASVRAIGVFPDVANLLTGKEDEVFPKLLEASQRCIEEDGAEAIILGSTTMHQAADYLAANLPVPVINPGVVTYAIAEAMIRVGLSQSRKAYPTPLHPKKEMIAAMVDAGVGVAEQAAQYATVTR